MGGYFTFQEAERKGIRMHMGGVDLIDLYSLKRASVCIFGGFLQYTL